MQKLNLPMGFLLGLLLAASASAEVRVYVQETNSAAWLRYECTAGEVVRAFALDVTVDKGRIIGISDFFRGPGTATSQGYGIFPAAFRDHIVVSLGTNINWDVSGYTPLAKTNDYPGDTLPGLNSSGVTLEFGGLWVAGAPVGIPGPSGTLCCLRISTGAILSVAANSSRGGVVSADPGVMLSPVFTGAFVQPPEITGLSLSNGLITVTFDGGELEAALTATGPWTGTTNVTGHYTESVANAASMFYRVRGR